MAGRVAKVILLASMTLNMSGCVVFEIRDELQKANQNLATANTQLMAANTELDIANAKLIEANSRLVQANSDLTVVNSNLTQTIQRLDGTNGQIATLQNKHLSTLDTRLDPLGKSLTEVDTHLGSLRKTLDNIDSMIPFLGITDSGESGAEGAPTGAEMPGTAPAATDANAPNSTNSPTASVPATPKDTTSRMIPETLQIDSSEFRLSVYMWRNFQPSVEPAGGAAPAPQGLLAKLNLVPTDKGKAPQGIEVAAIRLQRGKSVWTGQATKETGDTADTWERMVRSGPVWDMGAGVNVFVQLQWPDGSKKWIAAYNQTIERVD